MSAHKVWLSALQKENKQKQRKNTRYAIMSAYHFFNKSKKTNYLVRAALYNPQLKYMKCMNILKYIFIYLCNTVKCGD